MVKKIATIMIFCLLFTQPVYAKEKTISEVVEKAEISTLKYATPNDAIEQPKRYFETQKEWIQVFETTKATVITYSGGLTKQSGVCSGPSGKETYYNLNMSKVVEYMRALGYSEDDYPYWVRNDGVKMLGEYVMVAAALDIRPKGTIVETSLGPGIVCDTGSFVYSNQTQIDIAVTW